MSTERPVTPTRPSRLRRVLAVAAGVAVVPALFAVANATTGGGSPAAEQAGASRAHADDPATESETEHGVIVQKPHGGADPVSAPESTEPTVAPVTAPEGPEAEHGPEAEPGDDHGDDRDVSTPAPTPGPAVTQAFTSVGGSIEVTISGGAISLASSTPAAGFAQDVHDNGPTRVEVRFDDGGIEWRIRIELVNGALTSEITQHG
jgi:hypothetical protein